MPGYTVALAGGGGGPATSIKDLIDAGDNVTITGSGTRSDPYVISAQGDVVIENAYVSPGDNVVIHGVGTESDPYVISSVITGLIKAGVDIKLTGNGTTDDPYVIDLYDPAIGELLEAGDNITLWGAGNYGDPVNISADATGLVKAGENIAIDGAGTTASPYIVNALIPRRGEPVPLTLIPPAVATAVAPTLTRNPDGSVSVDGAFTVKGPITEGDSVHFANLPTIYAPAYPSSFPGIGSVDTPFQLSAAMVNMATTGEMSVVLPGIFDTSTITVHLNGITIWPVNTDV